MNGLKTSSLHSIPSKSTEGQQIRRKKIVNIRRQLKKGKYDINKRLDIALDRILEDLLYRRKRL